jgi:hypothetical protein
MFMNKSKLSRNGIMLILKKYFIAIYLLFFVLAPTFADYVEPQSKPYSTQLMECIDSQGYSAFWYAQSSYTRTFKYIVHYNVWYSDSTSRKISLWVDMSECDSLIDAHVGSKSYSYTKTLSSGGTYDFYIGTNGIFTTRSSATPFEITANLNGTLYESPQWSDQEWHPWIHIADQKTSGGTIWDEYYGDGLTGNHSYYSIPFKAAPPAPTNLSATDGSYTNKIHITWDASTGADHYEVYRNTSNISSSASLISGWVYGTYYDDSSVNSSTKYYYWAKAVTFEDIKSGFSNSDSGYVQLLAPTGVSASDGTWPDEVVVTWNLVTYATDYEVWRNTSNNTSTAKKIWEAPYSDRYNDDTVTAGVTYWYWVKARNSISTSGFSNVDSGYASCNAPSAPTGISASDGTYTDHVQVSWNAVSGATAYEVWRNTSNNSGSATNLGDKTSPLDDYGVTQGTTYYYWVKAKNNCGTSGFSSVDSGYACIVPPSPTGVSATDGTYTDHIQVTWNSVSGATAYEVWRGQSNSSGSATNLGDKTSPFNDYDVTPGPTYYYWVKAKNSCGTSGWSASDSGYANCNVPSAPTGVSATDDTYTDHIQVTWNSVSGATAYEVWRNTSNSSGSATNLGDKTSPLDDYGVTQGTTYYYWVKAKNNCGTSGWSVSDSGRANPCSVPSAPTGVSASDGTCCGQVCILWNSTSGAASYEIWRNTSNNSGSATKLMDTTSLSYTDFGATSCGTTYWYWIKAKNSCGTSGFSSQDSGYTGCQPSPPMVFATRGTYTDHIQVTWSSSAGATGYEIYRNTITDSGSATKLGDSSSPYNDYNSVIPGTYYYYWVKAKNSCGTSGFSNVDFGYASICSAPSAPTGVSATDGTYSDHVQITWNSVSGAIAYEVWRNTSNNSASATKLGDSTSPYNDYNSVIPGTYYYWVKAKNSCGTSGFSSVDSGYAYSPCNAPSAPTGVSATDETYTDHVQVSWNSVSGATAYEVWRNTSNNSASATKLGDYTSPYNDYGVTPNTTYYYWVKAKNSCGTSGFSASDTGYASPGPNPNPDDWSYNFTGALAIWDLSGAYSDSASGIKIDYVITQDAGGKLTGTGTASASISGVDLDFSFNVKGTVGAKNGAAWVKMTLKGKGTAIYEGESVKFSFSESVNAQIDSASRSITGTVKVRVSAKGHSLSEIVPFKVLLPVDMSGTATLDLNCSPSGKNRLGTSKLTLSNGEIYNFGVKGKYNLKKDESTLTLKGDAATKKNSLKIKVGSDGTIKTLSGKVLGQKLKAANISAE